MLNSSLVKSSFKKMRMFIKLLIYSTLTSYNLNYMKTKYMTLRINTTGQNKKKDKHTVKRCMLDRMRAHQQNHHQLQHQNQALSRTLPSPLGVYGRGGGYGRTDGRRHLATSRPWFYPVVEQHDVTYHRVKPLT